MSATEVKEFAVYAKTLTGFNTEIRTHSGQTIGELKSKVQEKLEAPIGRLVYNSKDLSNAEATLADYGIKEEAIIIVVALASKASHFFFALDESGSMRGRRWQQLLDSFNDFITARTASPSIAASKDRVTVCFHADSGRLATCSDGSPFDGLPLAQLQPGCLINDFRGGGTNFDAGLRFLTPYLRSAAAEYVPVLLFMTDGADQHHLRKLACARMEALKQELPELRLYVTVVFTTKPDDVAYGKQFCLAGGSDVETFFVHLEDEGPPVRSSLAAQSKRKRRGAPPRPHYPVGQVLDEGTRSVSHADEALSHDATAGVVFDAVLHAAPRSAQAKMAHQWEHAYQCNNSQF